MYSSISISVVIIIKRKGSNPLTQYGPWDPEFLDPAQ